jgi:hypothetical protein
MWHERMFARSAPGSTKLNQSDVGLVLLYEAEPTFRYYWLEQI